MMGVQLPHHFPFEVNVRAFVVIAAVLQPCNELVFDVEEDLPVDPTDPDASTCDVVSFVIPTSAEADCGPADAALVGDVGYPNLQGAIDAAPDGGVVHVCAGTYSEPLRITGRQLAVTSASGNATDTVLDGAGKRAIAVEDSTLTLAAMTVRGGQPPQGAGMRASGSSVWLLDAAFVDNVAGNNGGAVVINSGTLKVEGSSFTGNSADYEGGAIKLSDSCGEIRDAVFQNNVSDYGGGAVSSTCDSAGQNLGVWTSSFLDNRADYEGGAIAFSTVGDERTNVIAVWDSIFERNESGYEGGAIEAGGWSTIHAFVTGSTFSSNTSDYEGGAIATGSHGTTFLTVSTSTFVENSSRGGGAISNNSWPQDGVVVNDSTFERNLASGGGTAISVGGGDPDRLELTNVTFVEDPSVTQRSTVTFQEGLLTGENVDFEGDGVHLASPCGRRTLGADSSFVCDFGVWNP